MTTDLYLYHHGIKGQKWGVRRFQNQDGTLTNAGKKHKGLSEAYLNSFDKADKRLDQRIKNNQHEKKRAQRLTRNISDGSRLKNAYLNSFDSSDKRLRERKANNQYEKKRAQKLVNTVKKSTPKQRAAVAATAMATISVAQSIQNARAAEALMGIKLSRGQIASKTAVQAGKVAAISALAVIGGHMIHDYMKNSNSNKKE